MVVLGAASPPGVLTVLVPLYTSQPKPLMMFITPNSESSSVELTCPITHSLFRDTPNCALLPVRSRWTSSSGSSSSSSSNCIKFRQWLR
mmetsp:Transcript_23163/g.37199  ORF Transcript_23163/g.37199 Transcript_23163/m.37199 type:complete len:89 (+) Transcript_23163:118-384(+)